jgi:repressor LexA
MSERRARTSRPHTSGGGAPRRPDGEGMRARIVRAIEEYWREHGCPPTIREIAQAVDTESTGQVAYHIGVLKQQGGLRHTPGKSRGLMSTRPVGLQVHGIIGASGEPLDQFDPGEFELLDLGELHPALPALSARAAGEVYALRVRGTSMKDEGILDGDYVVIASGPTAARGAVVVAVQNNANGGRGAATLKRMFIGRDGILLQPANADVDPRFIPANEWDRDWTVQGTVVSVYRQYGHDALQRAAAVPRTGT